MKLIDVLREECVVTGARPGGKEEALVQVAETAARCSVLKGVSTKEIVEALKEREELGSTGFGKGIAIPHCRMESVTEFVVGIITVPDGVEFEVDSKKNTIVIKGIDKQKVGQAAAEIRKFRPPEPYKGKGVMYSTERIRRKAGKAAAGAKA